MVETQNPDENLIAAELEPQMMTEWLGKTWLPYLGWEKLSGKLEYGKANILSGLYVLNRHCIL